MAFKKTSEGRVFFQGSGNAGTANDARTPAAQRAPAAPEPGATGPTQLQILALLRSLNEKLKATQVERNAMRVELDNYRRVVDTLQNKSHGNARAEQLAQEMMREMEETRKLILEVEERQAGVEKEHKDYAEKIRLSVGGYRDLAKRIDAAEAKNVEVARQIAEATTQQAKIMRQIEKAIEDRARFMRKIERIEETVVQTRDALNAKAMVLLTDQNVAGGIPAADADAFLPREPGIPTAIPDEELARETWGNTRGLQAAAILLLVVGGILAGWAVSEIRRPQLETGEFAISEYEAPAATTPADAREKAEAIVDKWTVNEDTSAFDAEEPVAATATAVQPDPTDDIGLDLTDETKLQQMLEENSDALAAELNKIEPSAAPATEPVTEEAEIASLTPQETATIEQETPPTAAPAPVYTKSNVDVRTLIRPDSGLSEAVKKIEDQAFEGVPEAQHDLAAIYTAGHGGVKQDFERAIFWFEQSANSGVANAAYNLGVLNHQGLGTKPDIAKAIEWYTRAADLGHPEAQYNLGIAYIEGVGVQYDPFKANAYFEKAAAQGIMEAAYNLGLIYENGLLGKPEPQEALAWYKEAADKGSPEAKAALDQLAKTLKVDAKDINSVADGAKKARADGRAPPPPAAAPQKQSEAPTGNQRAVLAQIQEHLITVGLYPGPADGNDSPLSQDAIRTYQKLNNIEANGEASAALLVHMLSNEDADQSTAIYDYN
jgi:TPR repeat protein